MPDNVDVWRPIHKYSFAQDALAPGQPAAAYAQRSRIVLQGGRKGIFRKAAFFLLWLVVFVIPWENGVTIQGFGTITKVVGAVAFGLALLAVLVVIVLS